MEQQKHYHCIQDPEGIQLYTLTGHITKGAFITHLLLCQGFHFFGEFPSSFRAYDTWYIGECGKLPSLLAGWDYPLECV